MMFGDLFHMMIFAFYSIFSRELATSQASPEAIRAEILPFPGNPPAVGARDFLAI